MAEVARRKRAKRSCETAEFGEMVRRQIRAYARRVGDMDIAELPGLVALVAEAEQVTGKAVAHLRSEAGGSYSWADIARVLGVPRSTAQSRYEKYGVAEVSPASR